LRRRRFSVDGKGQGSEIAVTSAIE
jgi:hypothetical protein